jgi:hypothetical protein
MRQWLRISVTAVSMVLFWVVIANAAPPSNTNAKGWKFLTWGMSVDEVNSSLVKNSMRNIHFYEHEGEEPRITYGNDWGCYFESKVIKQGSSGYGDDPEYKGIVLYFIDEKLMAVEVKYDGRDAMTVLDQLKKTYPKGKSTESNYHYIAKNLIVYQENLHNHHSVWFVNPEVIKIKTDLENLKKQKKQKESEERAKKLF